MLKIKNPKAQSAMEYLMTYGWAILIIAVVLGALFSLGVFSSSSFLGTTCIASSGYECTGPLLHSGDFTFTFGQSTGSSWTAANVFFVVSGGAAPTGTPASPCAVAMGTLNSGQTFVVTGTALSQYDNGGSGSSCTAFSTTVGTPYSGALWVSYYVGATGPLITQVATVTLKAT